LLTVNQVADLLALHPRTVWRMVSAGELPGPISIGTRAKRWRLCDLESWITCKTHKLEG
jgi:excisionase family DNA binding protein